MATFNGHENYNHKDAFEEKNLATRMERIVLSENLTEGNHRIAYGAGSEENSAQQDEEESH